MNADIDVWRAATSMLKRHERDAAIVAAQRADECLAAGDTEGQHIWKRIVEAVLELLRELRAIAWIAITSRSDDCLGASISPDRLRRLSESAQERTAHAVAVGKTRLLSDDFNRMPTLLHHHAGGLDAQILHRLGW
jgi:hypothetical protein